MMRLYALLCLPIVALAACQRTEAPQKPTFAEDLSAILQFNDKYLGSINAEDIETLSGLTDEGHIMFPPNRPPVVGKAANDATNGAAFQKLDFDESWTPEETVISGDLAFQRGTFTTSSMPRGGGERHTVSGAFLRIYQRQPDGQWRMTRDMFNTDGVQH
ncbi:MAG TPA: nuclear transport factor 2 family protein [Gammaproteobacteria bacterium]|nr:nuclear transport factor 2 family protein [Gammaproteobacteria bacterium]